ALAERLQCILCADDRDAIGALELLKARNGGRAGIALPLEFAALTPSAVPGAFPLAGQVQADGPFAGLIMNLLATAMLVDDLGMALGLARQHPGLLFVTRDGDMVAHGGI